MLEHNNFNKKHFVVVGGLILVFGAGIIALPAITDRNNNSDSANGDQDAVISQFETDLQEQPIEEVKEDTIDEDLLSEDELVERKYENAETLIQENEYDKAILELQEALPNSTSPEIIIVKLGDTYLAKGDTQAAIRQYKSAIELYESYGAGYDQQLNEVKAKLVAIE